MAKINEKDVLDFLKSASPSFLTKAKGILGLPLQAAKKATTTAKGAGVEFDFGLTDMFSEQTAAIERNKEAFRSLGDAQRFSAETARELANESRALFGTSQEGNEVYKALTANMRTFAFLQKDVQSEVARTALIMRQFGIDASTTGEIMDTAALAFGMSQDKLAELGRGLATVVSKFPGQASEIARNFKQAQSSLAYDSGKIMEVFKKLQYTSSTTGVSFDKLTSAFGDSMDTFEGSAGKAGSLNAILGRSVFNSIDLLGKTEAERVDTIVKGVRSSIGGDVNRLGKFQLKAVAEGMGLSVEDTRRLLSGQATPDTIMKDKQDPRTKLQEESRKAYEANTMSLQELTTVMKTFESDRVLAIRKLNAENTADMLKFARENLGAQNLKALEEIPARLEQAVQVFLRDGNTQAAKGAMGMTAEQFLATRTGPNFTGNLLAEDLTEGMREKVKDYLVGLVKDLPDGAKQLGMQVKNFAKKYNIDLPGFGGSVQGGSDNRKPGQTTPTTDSAIDKLTNLFTEGNMKIEITGLDSGTLKGLLKTVKVDPNK